ncbi:MAG TPA: phosphatase domain-containing protein [Salinimicrobium sp.]|nr:phosphatase domain-containing protein [Salinimicrobium sp.]
MLHKFFRKDPLILVPYRTYGTPQHLYVLGRALEDKKLKIDQKQSIFRTIKNTYKQLESDEIRFADIELEVSEDLPKIHFQANSEGYFKVDKNFDNDFSTMTDDEGWMSYFLSFAEHLTDREIENGNVFQGEVLIPPKTAKFGVISDIDDTILETGVTSFVKWRVLHNTIFKNVYDRIPLEGASDFYTKLHSGIEENQNPVFYLSNSPWNLYQYLKLFLDSNNFPKGPILLRNIKTPFDRTEKAEKPHKQKEILNILKTYPGLNFILIGDSGEHDPNIYTEIAAQFPHRILAIYLRSVKHKRKMKRVQAIIDNYKTTPMLMVNKSEEAENHAREMGWIK